MSAKRKLVSELEAVETGSVAPTNINDYIAHHKKEGEGAFATFLEALAKKLPTCKFSPRGNNEQSLYVYLPSDLYALGWVGYNDYRIEGEGTYKTIAVYSHTISNDKYSSYNDQHYMLMSTNPKRAIKNALSHLRPYTPKELNDCFAYPVVCKVRDTNRENQEKVEDAQKAVTQHNQLQAELRAVVASGYQFVDADFGSKVAAFLNEVDEYALQTSEVNMFFVRAYLLNDQQMFDVTFLENAHNTWDYKVSTEPAERYTADTLPEHISGKLSVLMMCELDEYVDGVGIRMNDGVFYVNQ
jgi:hypothetical protein